MAWEAPAEASTERLDRYLARTLALPRNQIQRLIREGHVTVNGKAVSSSLSVAAGARLSVDVPPPSDDRVQPEEGALELLYEDEDLLVIDKPAGLAVHPGAGRVSGTLVHRLLHRYPELVGVGGPGRPGIVHRLDLGTSGVLVVARTAASYQVLAQAFARRRVDKYYLAIAYGVPRSKSGTIDAAIGRHPERRKEMALRSDGRPAVTRWKCRATAQGTSLFEVEIATGRTHQIRVHLKSLGHPLVGDPLYGEARFNSSPRQVRSALKAFPRPALHAWKLRIEHPSDTRLLTFEAPAPDDLRQLWQTLSGRLLEESLS